jgi:hypothetical protein
MLFPGVQRQAAAPVSDQLTVKRVLEMAMSESLKDLRNDSLQSAMYRCSSRHAYQYVGH